MDCEQALILISAALDGDLTEAERGALQAHMDACPDCRALAEDFGVLSVALSDMEVPAPEGLTGRVNAALDALDPPSAVPKPRRSWRAWGSLAALLALALCLGGVYHFSGLINGSSGGEAASSYSPPAPSSAGSDSTGGPNAVYYSAGSHLPVDTESAPQEAQDKTSGDQAGSGAAVQAPEAAPSTQAEAVGDEDAAPQDVRTTPEAGVASAGADPQETSLAPPPPAPPAPSEAPEEGISDPAANGLPSGGAGEAEEPGLTPLQALELVFTQLGGTETFPDAALDGEKPSYFLQRTQEDNREITRLLDYDGLSPNGLYYTFRQYVYVIQDGANGWAYTDTINRYAVSLDGGAVLSEFDADRTAEHAEAYYRAVND